MRTRRDYSKVYRAGMRCVGSFIIVEYCPKLTEQTVLGISVSKRYGNAVKRNRFKRLVRESFRLFNSEIPNHLMLNIKPRKYASAASLEEISDELLRLTSRS